MSLLSTPTQTIAARQRDADRVHQIGHELGELQTAIYRAGHRLQDLRSSHESIQSLLRRDAEKRAVVRADDRVFDPTPHN